MCFECIHILFPWQLISSSLCLFQIIFYVYFWGIKIKKEFIQIYTYTQEHAYPYYYFCPTLSLRTIEIVKWLVRDCVWFKVKTVLGCMPLSKIIPATNKNYLLEFLNIRNTTLGHIKNCLFIFSFWKRSVSCTSWSRIEKLSLSKSDIFLIKWIQCQYWKASMKASL